MSNGAKATAYIDPYTLASLAGPDRLRDVQEGRRIKEAMALDPMLGTARIERHGGTWVAIREAIREWQKEEYLPALRNKNLDFSEVQYARGAMDALDRLLELGGEGV